MEGTGDSRGEEQKRLLVEIRERLDEMDQKLMLILEKFEIPYPPANNGHPGMSKGKGTL